jgi:predicted nuclease of restriction endonuclease-like (RecB) superfamily
MLFHRLAVSKNKDQVLELASRGIDMHKPDTVIKDPYVLEFLGLSDDFAYKEGELEEALVNHIGRFLLELGKGFAYIGRQYRFSIAGRQYRVDLVFYHAILKTYVLIDLKRGEIQHEDIGQMNFYLNYFRNEVCTEGDNEPIGIVLGAKADDITMQYAMENISNQLFISRYQLFLPDKNELEEELRKVLDKNK